MTEIYVDADACPVKDEVMRVADRHRLVTHFVSNAYMRLPNSAHVRRVVVDQGPDVADDWIAERAGRDDVAVTADIPLAARCLENGAIVVGPTGKPFTNDSIGMALAMRDLNSTLRDTGEIRGGGPTFSKQDRSRFLQALEQAVQTIKRRG